MIVIVIVIDNHHIYEFNEDWESFINQGQTTSIYLSFIFNIPKQYYSHCKTEEANKVKEH